MNTYLRHLRGLLCTDYIHDGWVERRVFREVARVLPDLRVERGHVGLVETPPCRSGVHNLREFSGGRTVDNGEGGWYVRSVMTSLSNKSTTHVSTQTRNERCAKSCQILCICFPPIG